MNSKKYLSVLATLGVALSLILAVPAFAQTATGNAVRHGIGRGNMMGAGIRGMRGVFGTVSAINGNSLTVTSKVGPSGATATTYNVDATNAKVTKNNVTSSASAIVVGDTVMVQGTVSGSNVTATIIRDGVGKGEGMIGKGEGVEGKNGTSTQARPSQIPQGNGQPIVGGAVTAVNGNILTVTNKSNVTYSIDATNASVTKSGASSTLSSIVTGDNIIAQGTVNGTSVTASSIIDQGSTASVQNGNGTMPISKPHQGFFGSIGSFFAHLFGF